MAGPSSVAPTRHPKAQAPRGVSRGMHSHAPLSGTQSGRLLEIPMVPWTSGGAVVMAGGLTDAA